eukprot:Awhi_evm1s3188
MDKLTPEDIEDKFSLLDIGSHCNLCKRNDYLPFKCDGCNLKFCMDHRRPKEHHCKNPTIINKVAQTCKSCTQILVVPISETGSKEDIMKKHVDSKCQLFIKTKKNTARCQQEKCRKKDHSLFFRRCRNCKHNFCL